jgi:hypothetical protein
MLYVPGPARAVSFLPHSVKGANRNAKRNRTSRPTVKGGPMHKETVGVSNKERK